MFQEDRFDYHLPKGSLPRLLEIVKKILRRQGRLSKADMNRVEILRKEPGEDKKVIGIS